MDQLEPMPQDWTRALAIAAHPDDLEYGAASAVARWTAQGKEVRYLLATRGEAGIDTMAPEVAGPLRTGEQIASAAAVGVEVVEFLDLPDGLLEADLTLRAALAGAIRRHRPVNASTRPTHAVDVTDHLAAGVVSLECHRTSIDNLGGDFDAERFLRDSASAAGPALGVEYATTFELVPG